MLNHSPDLAWRVHDAATYTAHNRYDTIRYDTIGEFNVDWKAEY